MNNPDKIIIHHTVYADDDDLQTDDIDRMHLGRGWRGIGYHAVVEELGGAVRVVNGRSFWDTGAHCPGHNNTSLGVAFMGDFSEEPPSAEMLDTGARYVAGLCHIAQIPAEEIFPHRDFKATECPGDEFPWDEFVELVEDYLPR